MPTPIRADIQNRLLLALNAADFDDISHLLSAIRFRKKYPVEGPDQEIERIVFPDTGVISILAAVGRDDEVEVGLIGLEGMSGIAVVHGTTETPHRAVVQIEGRGWSIGSSALRQLMAKSESLKAVLLLYSRAQAVQFAKSALAFGRFSIEERLARWILMCHDRHGSDDLPLTHDLLSVMLGSRRAGITTTVHVLEVWG